MEFIRNILTIVNTGFSVAGIWINNHKDALCSHMSSNGNLSKLLLKLFDFYVTAQMYIVNGYQYAYTHYPVVREISNRSIYYSTCVASFIEDYKVEPYQHHWISTHILIKNSHIFKGNRYIHVENYQMMSNEVSPDCSYNGKIEQGFMYFFNILQSLITSLMHVVDAIVVMRDGDRYIIRSILNKHTTFDHVSSEHVFLSVTYKHPDMNKPIAIEIPAEMYQVGNVLFTPMFVKRYLEYQSLSYVFDNNYTLDIIDNEMNMLSMNSKQYAVLTEKSWTIIDISKEASDIDKNNHEEQETEEQETEEQETEEQETEEQETQEKETQEKETQEKETQEKETQEKD
uniref:Uncharacterized protein n=1 Tax=viral metagenome TaxID=1070528 RepID=A0A6C0ISU1_9ZZZZ